MLHETLSCGGIVLILVVGELKPSTSAINVQKKKAQEFNAQEFVAKA